MLVVFAGAWWLMALRGIFAVLFGISSFLWPAVALVTPTVLFGAYAFFDGVLSVSAAFWRAPRSERWWMLLFEGMVGLLAGTLAFVWAPIAAFALAYRSVSAATSTACVNTCKSDGRAVGPVEDSCAADLSEPFPLRLPAPLRRSRLSHSCSTKLPLRMRPTRQIFRDKPFDRAPCAAFLLRLL